MIASQLTFTAGTAATTIAGGGSITVYGMVLDNGDAADQQFVINESDDSTAIMRVDVQALSTVVSDIQFKADKGMDITAPDAQCNSTIFHSAPGL